MKGNIISRVSRIINGGFNSLVDAVESAAPETIMEQAIEEVNEAIRDVRNELGKVLADKHLANSRLQELHSKCAELTEQTELAVNQNRDDLAEAAISMQLDLEAQLPILEKQLAELSETEQELESYIFALQGKQGEMRAELAAFRQSRKTPIPGAPTAGAGKNSPANKVMQAEAAFDRVLESGGGFRPQLPTQNPQTRKALAELQELSRNNRVQERLAAIKSKREN